MTQKTACLVGSVLVGMLIVLGFASGMEPGVFAAQDVTPTLVMPPDPVMGEVDLAAAAGIDLAALPVVPDIGTNALLIYQTGILEHDNDPHAFAKVGDCMTDNPNFLRPIGAGEYALGEFESLESVIAYYNEADPNPFGRESQAAAGGFNVASVLDTLWANPEYCEAGETPLSCEFRISRPSVALIMFGTNDVFYLTEAQFDFHLRSIVAETILQGVLPVMSTFPLRPEFPDQSVVYNQIVAQIAQDYDVPLINLWRALEPLDNQGIDPVETTHMTAPADGAACNFLADNLQTGFTVRNLVTLQTLDALLEAAAGDAS